MCQPQINTDHLLSLGDNGRRNGDDDMQPPAPILVLDKVSRINWESSILGGMCWQSERDRHSASHRGETHRLGVPGQREGMPVVARGTGCRSGARHSATSFVARKGRFECFSRLDTRLNHQIRHQTGAGGFRGIIGRMMQGHAILFGACPAVRADVIKRGRKLHHRARQGLGLFESGVEYKVYSSLHTIIMPYTTSFCNIK